MNDSAPTEDAKGLRMGMLRAARLARAFAAQAEDLRILREKNRALETHLEGLRHMQERQRELVELGEREMGRLRRETESRLRAITLHTRDEGRRAKLSARLARADLSPRDLLRLYEAISEEFCLLYPTRRIAEPSDKVQAVTAQPESLARFRFRG